MSRACIVLSSGEVFEGESLGKTGLVTGEAVFTTGMTGYIETLTDPSYYGQIIVQTFPLIGNYGFIREDIESEKIHAAGYVVREACNVPSNFRCGGRIEDFLKENNIIGLQGIDTRKLTKILREAGVMNARIISGESEEAKKQFAALKDKDSKDSLLAEIKKYKIQNAVLSVSQSAVSIEKSASEVFLHAASYRDVPIKEDGTKMLDIKLSMKGGAGRKVVLWDFGAKANIRRELLKRGLNVITVSANTKAKDILKLKPDGIMLSNGPGDPEDNQDIIKEIKEISDSGIAIFGICLGHQLLALARGGKTCKLKYGHRGANQPVKNLKTGRIYITSQNHGFAVINGKLPEGAVCTFINSNDNTCEGIEYRNINAFSVQFHPEACAGPLDTGFLFDDFVARMGQEG